MLPGFLRNEFAVKTHDFEASYYISNIFHKTKDNSPSILSISLADTELYFHEEAGPVVLCPSESESRQPVALDTPRYPDKPVSVWDHAG